MSIRIVNQLEESAWREFIENHPQANIFHTPEMYTVFSKAQGYRPALWAAIDENDMPQALFIPVRITLRNGIFYPWTTRAVSFGSLLCNSQGLSEECLTKLLNEYAQRTGGKILFTELRNQSSLTELQITLNKCNFLYEDHCDYLVDLDQPEDTLWMRMSKSCRQRIKHAQARGTVIEEVTTPQQLSFAYHLLKDLYSSIHVPLAHHSLFQEALDICGPVGLCKIFLARAGEHYIGSAFNLMYKGKITAWYSASDRSYSQYNPGELLKWHVITWGKANGYHVFGFGGAGNPNEAYGPREFKAKFGGEQVNYGRNTIIHSPTRLRVSKTIYSLIQKVKVE